MSSKRFLCLMAAIITICSVASISGTIAWFTEEVTSAGNVINTGNLNVELYHSNHEDTNEAVDKTVTLFDGLPGGLWEPGVVVYENFSIKNAGNLALKYQLDLIVSNEAVVDEHKLSDVVQYAVIPGGFTGTDRNTAIQAGNAAGWKTLAEFSAEKTTRDLMLAGEEDQLGVILYWAPTANDNIFNMKNEKQGMVLDMTVTVKLTAAQAMHEADSFGNEYDKEAGFVQTLVAMPQSTEHFEVKSEDDSLVVSGTPANVNEPITVAITEKIDKEDEPSDIVIAEMDNGQTLTSFDIEVKGQASGSLVTVTLQMQPGLSDVAVFHQETKMNRATGTTAVPDTFAYDPVSGMLTLYVDHFSAFHFIYTSPGHNTAFKPSKEIQGYIKTLTDDVDLRDSAAPSNKPSASIPAGTVLAHYGTALDNEDNVWFYVKFQLGNKKYSGFVKGDHRVVATDKNGNPQTPSDPSAPSGSKDGLSFVSNGKGVTITDYAGDQKELIIPGTINGKPVLAIGDEAFYFCNQLTRVVIPEGVTYIGHSAFEKCQNLASVSLPSTLSATGERVFSECDALTAIHIPAKLTRLEDKVFYGCDRLKDVTFGGNLISIGDRAFSNCIALQYIRLPSTVTSIESRCFANCSNLSIVEIPGGVKEIDENTFSGCFCLNELTLNDGLEHIRPGAFSDCIGLKTLDLPDTILSVAFGDYSPWEVETINFPESLEAFVYRDDLSAFPENITVYENSYAHYLCKKEGINYTVIGQAKNPLQEYEDFLWKLTDDKKGIVISAYTGSETNVIIPDSINGLPVREIACGAFAQNHKVKTVEFPETLIRLGDYVFYDCYALEDSTGLSQTQLSKMGEYVFAESYNMISASLPASITHLPDYTYANCSALVSLYLPGVTSIGNFGCFQCTQLARPQFSSQLTSVGDSAFLFCEKLLVDPFPDTMTYIGEGAFGHCESFTRFPGLEYADSIIGTNEFSQNPIVKEVILPDHIERIRGNSFCLSGLEKVKLPSKIVSIGEEAFSSSKLSSLDLPDTVKRIAMFAFAGCNQLEKVEMSSSIKFIEMYAFSGCTKLKEILLPETIVYIAPDAFERCTALTAKVYAGSYAQQWCEDNNLPYQVIDK